MELAVIRQCFSESTVRGDSTGPNPTDRGKLGTKRNTLVDRRGVPLSTVVTAANRHDMKSALSTMDSIVVDRPKRMEQNICMDKGYDFPEIEYGAEERGYIDHIRQKGEAVRKKLYRAKRWVVERTASWHNRFRKLLIRYEKKEDNYKALVEFANCLIVYRAIHW